MRFRPTRIRVVLGLFLFVTISALLSCFLLRAQIRVQLWHFFNGKTARLQEYDIPVPEGWIPDQGLERTIKLIELGTDHSREIILPVVYIRNGSAPDDMNLFLSMHEQVLESEGASILERRTIEVDGEKLYCITDNGFLKNLSTKSSYPDDMVISITCQSTGGLSITYGGDKKYVDTFFSIVSQIRKHNL